MISMTTPEALLFWFAQTPALISALDRAYGNASAYGSAAPGSIRMDVVSVIYFIFF